MDSRALTLGVVAGLAVAGLARRASGSGNTVGGRFRRIASVPAGSTDSPLLFVRGTALELAVRPEKKGKAQPGTGLYHVTTNLPAVLAEGRLRSRRACASFRSICVVSGTRGNNFCRLTAPS